MEMMFFDRSVEDMVLHNLKNEIMRDWNSRGIYLLTPIRDKVIESGHVAVIIYDSDELFYWNEVTQKNKRFLTSLPNYYPLVMPISKVEKQNTELQLQDSAVIIAVTNGCPYGDSLQNLPLSMRMLFLCRKHKIN